MILMMRLGKHYCQYVGFAQESRLQHGEGYHELQLGLWINPENVHREVHVATEAWNLPSSYLHGV